MVGETTLNRGLCARCNTGNQTRRSRAEGATSQTGRELSRRRRGTRSRMTGARSRRGGGRGRWCSGRRRMGCMVDLEMESRTLPTDPCGPAGRRALLGGGCGGRGRPTDPAQGRRQRRCGGGAGGSEGGGGGARAVRACAHPRGPVGRHARRIPSSPAAKKKPRVIDDD